MHPRSLILVALICVAGLASADTVRIDCKPGAGGVCPAPPAPPAPPQLPQLPPLPPVPPLPPIPAIAALPAIPALPAMPAPPPPPPAPPALPEVPADAHAACASKSPGSKLSLRLGPNETMAGVCERAGGKMVFHLRGYRRND